jgi:phenylalanyl-tRNA synthetase alpha chain
MTIKENKKRNYIIAHDPKSDELLLEIKNRKDINGIRLQKLLSLPDLSRKENSPLKFIVDKIVAMPEFKNFDVITTPEIVSVRDIFDLLNAPADHPSRKETDTYYVNKDYVLRTQTTVMWTFYLQRPEVRKQLEEYGELGLLSFGKVFRKDEIDRNHFPVFHQVDGLYLCKTKDKAIGLKDLQDILEKIAKNIYGESANYKFLEDTFPFTDPSTQIEIQRNNDWLEIVGAGVVHKQVLANLGIDPNIYNGWAFGFGLERLAMIKNNISDIRIFWSEDPRITKQFTNIDSQYQEVSKYPMTYRDISFVVSKKTSLNNYYEIVRDCADNLVEEVKLSDKYENKEKFGEDKISYTFRIIYRSPERTLTNEEVNIIQERIQEKTIKELNAKIR